MNKKELLQVAKPILFNTEMVKAILEGRKTVTRRCVKFIDGKNPNWTGYVKDGLMLYNGTNEPCCKKPLYNIGDILYVRETWRCWRAHRYEANADIMFKAGGEGVRLQFDNGNTDSINRDDYDAFVHEWYSEKWKPSIFMPKEAARIFLKVKDVRVERLQDITEEQATKEGCQAGFHEYIGAVWGDEDTDEWTAVEEFMDLWNSTIKKEDIDTYGWDASPYVWVIEFERIEVE